VGAWAATDWVPILVKTSLTLGCLPDAEGVRPLFHLAVVFFTLKPTQMITWIPYTTVAQVVMDIALGSSNPSSVLNVVHPRPVPWNSIMQDIAKALVEQDVANVPLELIPFNSWYEKLERHSFASSEKDLLALVSVSFYVVNHLLIYCALSPVLCCFDSSVASPLPTIGRWSRQTTYYVRRRSPSTKH
jgi:thioester reductase-like protein